LSTFTTTLPKALLDKLAEHANRLSMPKNKLIEKALEIYLDQLNRAEYIKSYKQMADDTNIMLVAEEGMEDYLKQLNNEV
jgi:metal-responsive CopG/Arc/MetJ family transcriptional regulator